MAAKSAVKRPSRTVPNAAPWQAFGDGARRYLPLIVALLVFAPHVSFQPAVIFIAVLFALAWSGLVIAGQWRHPSRLLMITLALLASGLVVQQYGRIWGQEAGTALLLLMAALKLMEARNTRDFEVFLFLAYFVVATQYFFDQAVWIAAQSILAVLVITTTLNALHSSPDVSLANLLRRAGLMLVHALPIMLLLFIVFPRIQGAAISLPTPNSGMTGLSESMQPGEISELIQREGVVARVRFDEFVPGPADQYWRAIVLSHYDGRRWTRGATPGNALPPGDGDAAAIHSDREAVRYTVNLEPTRPAFIPLLETPAVQPTHTAAGEWNWGGDGTLRSSHALDQRIRYEGAAWIGSASPVIQLSLDDRTRSALTALPASTAPEARRLIATWKLELGIEDATAVGDQAWALIARALEHFGRDPFRYTLRPPRALGDATDAFLFETRAGFCEDYASAFAVLMRAAGIPTRIVTGYQGGRFTDRGGYLSLRYADAHAWNEVWIDGRGWVRVDPTASIAPNRIEGSIDEFLAAEDDVPAFLRGRQSGLGIWTRAHLEWMDWRDWVEFQWTSWVLAFDPERQRDLFARLGLDFNDWRHILAALLGLIVAGFSAAAVYLGVQKWRHRPDVLIRRSSRLARTLRREWGRSLRESSIHRNPRGVNTEPLSGPAPKTWSNPTLGASHEISTPAPPDDLASLHRWLHWAKPWLADHAPKALECITPLNDAFERARFGPPDHRARAKADFMTNAKRFEMELQSARQLRHSKATAPLEQRH
ncbi:MAG: transglutaminaseTgpA domain-containing protein [Thioalkalivibrionaceae bacterium]